MQDSMESQPKTFIVASSECNPPHPGGIISEQNIFCISAPEGEEVHHRTDLKPSDNNRTSPAPVQPTTINNPTIYQSTVKHTSTPYINFCPQSSASSSTNSVTTNKDNSDQSEIENKRCSYEIPQEEKSISDQISSVLTKTPGPNSDKAWEKI